jgi:hypothetical protein
MSYALGTSAPPAAIDTLLGATALTGSRLPQDRFYAAEQTLDRVDGHQADQGLPYVVWAFGVLSQAMLDNLRVICPGRSADVYLTTRDDDGNFETYTAIMLWPVNLAERRQLGGKFVSVEFTFRNLEVYP